MSASVSSRPSNGSMDSSVLLNQRPVTLEEVEVCLNLSKHAMWFADFDPSNRQLVWSNHLGLKVNHKKDNEEFRSIDIVSGTSKKMLDQQLKLYQEVQVEHKRFPETHITLYPGGVPTPASFDAVPILAHFPWMPASKVLCLVRIEPIVAQKESSKVDDERNRSNEILSYSEILTLLFSEDGTLLQSNQRAAYFYLKDLSTHTPEEAPILQLNLKQLLDTCVWDNDTAQSEFLAQIKGLYRTKSSLELKVMKNRVNEQGKQIWHLMTFIACYDPVTGKAAMLVNEADISDLKEMSVELIEAQKAREAFFTAISHELRTPLHGIIGLASSMIGDESTSPAAQNILRVLKSTGQKLAGLVGDILDAADIREGSIIMKHEKISLHDAAARAIESMVPLARKGVEMENKVPTDLTLIEGDNDRIVQVLMNLVGNALRFTRSGSIKISSYQESSSSVVLKVSDTGSGILPEQLDTLFIGPQTVSQDMAKLVGLSGLGLPLVKMLVEGHSGSIDVTSSVGVGTEFRITLPITQVGKRMKLDSITGLLSDQGVDTRALQRIVSNTSCSTMEQEAATQAGAQASSDEEVDSIAGGNASATGSQRGVVTSAPSQMSPESSGKIFSLSTQHDATQRAHILVVDDDAIGSLVTERLLEQMGYTTTAKSSGFEALDFLLNADPMPDLLLAAASMTDMDGLTMTRHVREVFRSEDLPIILIVADTHSNCVETGVAIGVDEFIHTPINKSELELRVKLLLRIKDLTGYLAERDDRRAKSLDEENSQPRDRRISVSESLPFSNTSAQSVERVAGSGHQDLWNALEVCADLRAQIAMQQCVASRRERKLMKELSARTDEVEKLRTQVASMECALRHTSSELQVEKDLVQQAMQQLDEKRIAVWDLETRMGAAARNHKFGLSVVSNRDANGHEEY